MREDERNEEKETFWIRMKTNQRGLIFNVYSAMNHFSIVHRGYSLFCAHWTFKIYGEFVSCIILISFHWCHL